MTVQFDKEKLSNIYFTNKILTNGYKLYANICCKRCNSLIGGITSEYPAINYSDIDISVPNVCPNCGIQIIFNKFK